MEDCNCIYDWEGGGANTYIWEYDRGRWGSPNTQMREYFYRGGRWGDRRYMPLGVLFLPGGGGLNAIFLSNFAAQIL